MKKYVKQIVLSSLAALSFATIGVGTTFALFTSSTETTIKVESGKIDLSLTPRSTGLHLYSAVYNNESGTEIDENGYRYSLVEQQEKFLNGGTATISESVLNIEKMTPGDKIEFAFDVADNSNVAYNYRLSIDVVKLDDQDDDGYIELVKHLVSNINFVYQEDTQTTKVSENIDGVAKYRSEWSLSTNNKIYSSIEGDIYLPIDSSNELQDKSLKMIFTLEAVQGNAHVEGGKEKIIAGSSAYEVVPVANSANYTIYKTNLATDERTATDYVLTADPTRTGLFGNGNSSGIAGKGDVVYFNVSDDPDLYGPTGKWIINDGVSIVGVQKNGEKPNLIMKDGPFLNLNGDFSISNCSFTTQATGVYYITPNVLDYNGSARTEALHNYTGTITIDKCDFTGKNESISEDDNNKDYVYGIQADTSGSIIITNSTFTNFGGYKSKDKHGMIIAGFRHRIGTNTSITLRNNTFTNVYTAIDFLRSGDGLNDVTDEEIRAWENNNTFDNVAYKTYDYNAH